jgi:hypothetical protein
MRYRRVIEVALSARLCESFERAREFLQCFKRPILRQIRKCQPYMIGMMEPARQAVRFKAVDEFFVVHGHPPHKKSRLDFETLKP